MGNFGGSTGLLGLLYESTPEPFEGELFTASKTNVGLGTGETKVFRAISAKLLSSIGAHGTYSYWYIVLEPVIDPCDDNFMRGISS